MTLLGQQNLAHERIAEPLDLVVGTRLGGTGAAVAVIVAAASGRESRRDDREGERPATRGREDGAMHVMSPPVMPRQRLIVPQMPSLPGAPFSSIELGSSTTMDSTLKPWT